MREKVTLISIAALLVSCVLAMSNAEQTSKNRPGPGGPPRDLCDECLMRGGDQCSTCSGECGGCCPLESNAPAQTVSTMRLFKDEWLLKSKSGTEYVGVFEAHKVRATHLFLVEPQLALSAQRVFTDITPKLAMLTKNRGKEAQVTRSTVTRVERFLQLLEAVDKKHPGGGPLARDVKKAAERINFQS